MTHIYESHSTSFKSNMIILIIKDDVLSFSWILLFLDVKLSHINESCMMSHLTLSCADDMLILIDLKF